MKLLHTSDLHGSYHALLEALAKPDWDVWCDAGDFFPNKTRGEAHIEVGHQTRWFGYPNLASRITEAMKGRPLVSVPGNHDYVSLATLVSSGGGLAFGVGKHSPKAITLGGKSFAGFREIPWIEGEWAGETPRAAFKEIVDMTLAKGPDILLTHAPPNGILDDDGCGPEGGGIEALTSSLCYTPHSVKQHLFGHIHQHGGVVEEKFGIRFCNGATKITIHSIE